MPTMQLDRIKLPPQRGLHVRRRLWREWCFIRAAFKHYRFRLLFFLIIILGGGILFQKLEPEKNLSLPEATYYTWSLVFGEAPEAFPSSGILQVLFFAVPVLGLTVIIEGMIDLALMLRDRSRCEKGWCMMMASSLNDHVVLVGLGRLGFRTFHLLRRLGEQLVVIERDAENQFLEDIRRSGSPLFIGDARREALLDEANVAKARSIILATNDDLANLEIALDARSLAPDIRVVVRMFDQNMADKICDGLNIHIAMSQSAISAPAFATAAIDPSIVGSLVVGDQLVVIKRWRVRDNGPLNGKTVGDVLVGMGCSVIQHRPKDRPGRLFPPPATRLTTGDEILVQGPFDTLVSLKRESSDHA